MSNTHAIQHLVGGVTPDEGLSWYSCEEVFGDGDSISSLDRASAAKIQFVRISSEMKGCDDTVKILKQYLDVIRVYDVWWKKLKREENV
jgi:hypothetical protein